jgi:adenine-specific DNA-methyltransferase
MNNKNKIELTYVGKETEREIITKKPSAMLEKVKSFGNLRLDGWENMLIFGDNLIALKLLYKNSSIKGKVRLIYIDPPFSTNQIYKGGEDRTATVSKSDRDKEAYEDILVGSEYLEFLRKRLILLRDILANDGSIYVHIDWKMGHYVKVLMDEVFGQERFINDITRIKCNPKNFARKGYGNIKDMVLFYSRTDRYVWHEPREEMTEEDIKRLFPKLDKDGRRYTTTPLHAPGETRNGPTGQPWKGLKPPKGRHWRYSPDELDRLDEEGLIEWSSTGNPRKIIYADEVLAKGKKRQDIWEFKDPPYPTYPTEKNLEMLKMIIEASSNPDDIVLDCFAGSGTTLVAAEETGRRWIGIDNSHAAIEVAQRRLISIKNHSAFGLYEIREMKT